MFEFMRQKLTTMTNAEKLQYFDRLIRKIARESETPISIEIAFMPNKKTRYILKNNDQVVCYASDINVFIGQIFKIFDYPHSPLQHEELRVRNKL